MLFGPEDGEQFRDPRMDRSEAMKTGVTGGADRDKQIGITVPGMPMVNMKKAGRPAARAPIPVALKHAFPVSAEVIARVPAHPVTLGAEAGDGGDPLTAGAEQRPLAESGLPPGPQDAFRSAGEG